MLRVVGQVDFDVLLVNPPVELIRSQATTIGIAAKIPRLATVAGNGAQLSLFP